MVSNRQGEVMTTGSHRTNATPYPCTQNDCVCGFSTEEERQEHEKDGQHEAAIIRTNIDSIILYFVNQKKLATARDSEQSKATLEKGI